MSKIEYPIPIEIKKLQALQRRLPANHEKQAQIQEELAMKLSGYYGVVAVKYFFHLIDLTSYQTLIDIRLTNDETHYFQMDILLLSTKLILILEVKNISGTLYFDTNINQCIRTLHDKEEGFGDPILQVQRQRQQLITWLQKHKYPAIPIIPYVVISNPSTIIKSNSTEISKIVIHAASLSKKIQQLEKSFPNPAMSLKELTKIKRSLIKQNQPHIADVFHKFDISTSDIKSGVECPSCSYIPMIRLKGVWYCPKCKKENRDAHLQAIDDYALLKSNTITNAQLREFLHIPSKFTASRILHSLKLTPVGREKARKYFL